MASSSPIRRGWLLLLCVGLWLGTPAGVRAADAPARVYVILWFDTEDYILPASDDAALRVADFLSREKVRATFKVVGEKARTLERRERSDVIAALKKHEIGYHSNWHSVQPSPAMYLGKMGRGRGRIRSPGTAWLRGCPTHLRIRAELLWPAGQLVGAAVVRRHA